MITYWVRAADYAVGNNALDECVVKAADRKVHFVEPVGLDRKADSLSIQDSIIDWNVEVLEVLLREIVVVREAQQELAGRRNSTRATAAVSLTEPGKSVFDEWKEIIYLPEFNADVALRRRRKADSVSLAANVVFQLKDFVSTISHMYRGNAFHNFEVRTIADPPFPCYLLIRDSPATCCFVL